MDNFSSEYITDCNSIDFSNSQFINHLHIVNADTNMKNHVMQDKVVKSIKPDVVEEDSSGSDIIELDSCDTLSSGNGEQNTPQMWRQEQSSFSENDIGNMIDNTISGCENDTSVVAYKECVKLSECCKVCLDKLDEKWFLSFYREDVFGNICSQVSIEYEHLEKLRRVEKTWVPKWWIITNKDITHKNIDYVSEKEQCHLNTYTHTGAPDVLFENDLYIKMNKSVSPNCRYMIFIGRQSYMYNTDGTKKVALMSSITLNNLEFEHFLSEAMPEFYKIAPELAKTQVCFENHQNQEGIILCPLCNPIDSEWYIEY